MKIGRIEFGSSQPKESARSIMDDLHFSDRARRERTDAVLADLSKRIAQDEYALHMIAERCGDDAEEMRRWAVAALTGRVVCDFSGDVKAPR